MNCWPCTFFRLALLPSHRWTCPSMMKMSSPLLVRYMVWVSWLIQCGRSAPRQGGGPAWAPMGSDGRAARLLVGHRVLHIAKQYDGMIIDPPNAPLVARCG